MKKTLKIFGFSMLFFLILLLGYGSLYLYAYFTPKLPINGANGYYFYDREDNLYETNSSNEWVRLEDISEDVIHATVSIEDKHFFEHIGFDYLRIIKALLTNIKNGENSQGASTITQQYAKNLFLDFDKTWKRKIDEAWLTIQLETQYSKEEILEGYLNTINYGGIFGIENASHYYFGKDAKDLTLAEAAMLAGIPKFPSYYSPLVNEEAAISRQHLILSSMVKNGYITEEQKKEAEAEELVYVGSTNKTNSSTIMYYQDAVLKELKSISSIPTSFLQTGGLKIYTNFDRNAQMSLENSMNANMTKENLQIAASMMDPNTGEVLALIGGRDYSKSQFNRAISSKRQVGSTIKPFLYYAALENGFTSSTTFRSEKTTFTFAEDEPYSPTNYGDKYPNREISLATAIAYSDNIYAVKTHVFLGEEALSEMARRVGMETEVQAVPSSALGTTDLNLMEMMEAYGTLASGGYKSDVHFIRRVEDINGNVLYEYKPTPEMVLNKSLVYILNELLTNTSATEFVDYSYPTLYGVSYKMSRKYAVKSGSTPTDHLVFGYTPDLVLGIWTGYDDNSPSESENSATIKNIWVDAMEDYLKDTEEHWYEMPNNVVGVLVDPISGELASTSTKKKKIMYYIKGTEPSLNKTNLDDSIPTMKFEE